MEDKLKELQAEALTRIESSNDMKELNEIRIAYLGKKAQLQKY